MKRLTIAILSIATLLMGFGCSRVQIGSTNTKLPQPQSYFNQPLDSNDLKQFAWETLDDGVDRGEQSVLRGVDDFQAHIVAYRFDPAKYSFRFASSSSSKLISSWAKEVSPVFVMNGVYFRDDKMPAGALRINGKDIGSRAFDKTKSGIIAFENDGLHIVDTSSSTTRIDVFSSAAQSYPFLVKNGEIAIKEDSGQVSRRSFIGRDKDGKIIIGVFVGGQMSLYDLAQELKALPINWESAMNLDGGSSTGFSANINGTKELEDSYVDVPNVIEVEKR